MDKSKKVVIIKLFTGDEHIYALLWWSNPKSNVINVRRFIDNGHGSVPIFSSEVEGKRHVASSGHENELVSGHLEKPLISPKSLL